MVFRFLASRARRLVKCALLPLLCFATLQAARAQEKCVAAPSGLIGWWRGESDGSDAVSKTKASLDTALPVAGKVGGALSFANAATTVQSAAVEDRNEQVQNGFTLELWVNPRDAESGEPLVEFRRDDKNVGVHLWIYDQAGQIWGNVMDTMGDHHVVSSGAGVLLPGVWQHIALVYDRAGTASIYFNGTRVARKDIGSFSPQMGYDLYLGGHRPGDPDERFFRGALDEVSLYNRPLAREEIDAIYRAGASGKCAPGGEAAASARAGSPRAKTALPKAAPKAGAASTRASSSPRWSGRCMSVLEGDTMIVRRGSENVRVQLFGVASPRLDGQNFGPDALLWTEARAKNKTVTVYPVGKGDEGQQLAWVFAGTQSLNAEITRAGLAWWDERQAPRETKLQNLMNQSRAARRGLWSLDEPIAPWAFLDEEDYAPFSILLQKHSASFPLLKRTVGADGKPSFSTITLNANPMLDRGERYDGFRFKAETNGARDFVWAFVSPGVEGWNVKARRGTMKTFALFFPRQRSEFEGLDNLLPRTNAKITLQHLSGSSLTPGAEYFVWFRFRDDKPVTFSLAHTFADIDGGISDRDGDTTDQNALLERAIKALALQKK